MARIKIFLLAILFTLFAVSNSLAFYEYVDEHGVTRYTDDINEVPADQRHGKQEVDLSGDTPDETTGNANQIDTKAASSNPNTNKKAVYDESLSSLEEKVKAIKKEKAAIEKEDDELLKKKLALKPGDDIEEYNKQVAILNKKTKELDQRRKEYNVKVRALNDEIQSYNDEVAEELQSQLKEYETIKKKYNK